MLNPMLSKPGMTSRKDPVTGDWVLHNPKSGYITRVNLKGEVAPKAGMPDLVDIKITDYCPISSCAVRARCYMSSTTKGKHARIYNWDKGDEYQTTTPVGIETVLEVLQKAGATQIVYGGGEPTEHPRIRNILMNTKSKGFTTGITTRNYQLHLHKDFGDPYYGICANLDSIAFSCNSIADLQQVSVVRDEMAKLEKSPVVYIQNILELTPQAELVAFMDECKRLGLNYLTLLGYKDFGFGAKVKRPHPYDSSWLKAAKDSGLRIGLDSIAVRQWNEELVSMGVKLDFLQAREGAYSCYVDAVRAVVAPSSFCAPEAEVKIQQGFNSDWFIKQFERF